MLHFYLIMKQFNYNGVKFTNFGSNTYSEGMELVATSLDDVGYPIEDLVKKVLNGEFHGIWLNPSAPCTKEEFFGVFGTREQYEEFYRTQHAIQILKGKPWDWWQHS